MTDLTKTDLSLKEMRDMPLNYAHCDHINDAYYRRVPGGWVYYDVVNDQIVNSTFVPDPEIYGKDDIYSETNRAFIRVD